MRVRGKWSGAFAVATPYTDGLPGQWYVVYDDHGDDYIFDTKEAMLSAMEEVLDNEKDFHGVSHVTRADDNIFKDLGFSDGSYPDNNPKTKFGMAKAPLHLVPPSVKHFLAKAFADGAAKYGPYNWRDKKVSSSVYFAALNRHMDAWWDGEDVAEDSKIEHLAHASACIAILIDAYTTGSLIDDRPTKGAASRLQQDYMNKGESIERDKHTVSDATQNPVVKPRLSCCEEDVLPQAERE